MLINKKERTVGRSFRLKEKCLKSLTEEAEKDGISPNALMNKILEDYSIHHRYFKRFGSITLSRRSFSQIIETCSEKDLREIAKEGGLIRTQDLFHILRRRFNRETMIFLITQLLDKYANWFKCEHYIEGNKEIFHLRHELGNKWSFYIAEVFSTIFEVHLGIKVGKKFLRGAVTLEVPLDRQL